MDFSSKCFISTGIKDSKDLEIEWIGITCLSLALLPCRSAFSRYNHPSPPRTALLQYFVGCFYVRCRSLHHGPWTCVLNLNWARKNGTDDKHCLFSHPTFEKLSSTSLVTLSIFNFKEQKLIPSTIKLLHSLTALLSLKKHNTWMNLIAPILWKKHLSCQKRDMFLKSFFNWKASRCLHIGIDVFDFRYSNFTVDAFPIQGRAG